MIVTATREKMLFSDIEQAITRDPLFEQAYVFGDNQPLVACAVVLSDARWRPLAAAMALDPDAEASWRSPAVAALMLEVIGELTSAFPDSERPRAVSVSLAPGMSNNTLPTPAMMGERAELTHHYAPEKMRVYPCATTPRA